LPRACGILPDGIKRVVAVGQIVQVHKPVCRIPILIPATFVPGMIDRFITMKIVSFRFRKGDGARTSQDMLPSIRVASVRLPEIDARRQHDCFG